MPSQSELDALYNDGWSRPDRLRIGLGGMNRMIADSHTVQLAKKLGIASFNGLRLLDFGAGRGSMAESLQRSGAEVTVLDPYGVDYLRSKGFIAAASLDDLPAGMRFDGILALDVVEHLPKPWVVIREFRKRLAPHGWTFIATVNTRALKARLQRSRWDMVNRPHHVMFLPPDTLSEVMNSCGFPQVERLYCRIRYNTNIGHAFVQSMIQSAGLGSELYLLCRIGHD